MISVLAVPMEGRCLPERFEGLVKVDAIEIVPGDGRKYLESVGP